MIITKLKLSNIRSYTTQEITFPRGTVLLSGDIGSGKSTILHALEFALFGITKEVTGPSLLRSGTSQGHVELHFTIDGKNIIIHRTLKRGTGVTQDAGFLLVDGMKKELTPTELKQFILATLCYPAELLTKKSLIYRYTVYTPQEEMKHILLADASTRLDLLRKVFGIDKYKRIIENTDIFISCIKQKLATLKTLISSYDEKHATLAALTKTLAAFTEQNNQVTSQLASVRASLAHQQKELATLEHQKELLIQLHRDIDVVTAHLTHTTTTLTTHTTTLASLTAEIQTLHRDIAALPASPALDLAALNHRLTATEEELHTVRNEIQKHRLLISNSRALQERITTNDVCPVCTQPISPTHVAHVTQREDHTITTSTHALEQLTSTEHALLTTLATLKHDIQTAHDLHHQHTLALFQHQTLDKRTRELATLHTTLDALTQQLATLTSRKDALTRQLASFSSFEARFAACKQRLDALVAEEKKLHLTSTTLTQEIRHSTSQAATLTQELHAMDSHKRSIETLTNLLHWLTATFIPLIILIEQHIMLTVHADFDAFFRKWFALLVDAELLHVRLDESFNLVIEQNGHDIEYVHLSGGEKTAAALAYRLALNHIINTLVSTIKTKDLLILDEPTDGFSSEQLDRIRVVLDELDAHQIIIVSHEEKIESFVEHVIRLRKEEHVSRVIS